jgi:N-acetylneuraminic acid mutarotase
VPVIVGSILETNAPSATVAQGWLSQRRGLVVRKFVLKRISASPPRNPRLIPDAAVAGLSLRGAKLVVEHPSCRSPNGCTICGPLPTSWTLPASASLRRLTFVFIFISVFCFAQTPTRPVRPTRSASGPSTPQGSTTLVTATGIVFPDGTQLSSASGVSGSASSLPTGVLILSTSASVLPGFSQTGEVVFSGDYWSGALIGYSGFAPSGAMIAGKRYIANVIGQGFTGNFQLGYRPATYMYDPLTNTWKRLADIPTPRRSACSASVNGRLLVIGGTTTGYNTTPAVPINTVEAYDPVTDSWTTLSPMPTARFGTTAAVIGSSVYVIGGFDSSNTSTAIVEKFDPTGNSWSAADSLPAPLGDAMSVAIDSGIIVFGGHTILGQGGFGDVYEYNAAAGVWNPRANKMMLPVHSAGAVIVANHIYVFGGISLPNGSPTGTTQALYVTSDVWSLLRPALTPRRSTTVGAVGNTIFVIGGQSVASGWASAQPAEVYHAPKLYYVVQKQ